MPGILTYFVLIVTLLGTPNEDGTHALKFTTLTECMQWHAALTSTKAGKEVVAISQCEPVKVVPR